MENHLTREKLIQKELPAPETLKIDKLHYYDPLIHGFYEQKAVLTDNRTRAFHVYIPDGGTVNIPAVFLAVPAGAETAEFLISSGWKSIADEDKVMLAAMEPEGEWKSPEEELPYLRAVRAEVSRKVYYAAFNSAYYLAGYEGGADAVQYAAMSAPHDWAGVVSFGGKGLPAETCAELAAAPSRAKGISNGEVALPAWIAAPELSEGLQNLIRHWKTSNRSQPTVYSTSFADELYFPAQFEHSEINSHSIAKVGVTRTADYSPELVRAVWKEALWPVRRYTGTPNGELRAFLTPEQRGAVRCEEIIDGYSRWWYEYVPENVRKHPEKAVPLVVVLPGRGADGYVFFDRTCYYKLAEERNFIVLFATAAMNPNYIQTIQWNVRGAGENVPDDYRYIRRIVEHAEERYPIDKSRVYATGHSMGSMMSMCVAKKLPDIFTATASSAGVISGASDGFPEIEADTSLDVPVMVTLGEYDDYAEGKLDPVTAPVVRMCMGYWTERYHTAPLDKPDYSVTGDYENYIYRTPDGVPMVRYTIIRNKVHAIIPDETRIMYDEFLSRFRREPDGRISYMNR